MEKNYPGIIKIAFLISLLLIILVLMCGCTTTPSTPSPGAKTVLYSDNLSQWQDEWNPEYDGPTGKIFYSGGSLHIRDTNPPEWTLLHTFNKNFNDFILDVDATLINGTTEAVYGVNVRAPDSYNYYGFSISGNGGYSIRKQEFGNLIIGRIIYFVHPTRSSFIETGIGATNHIHIEAKDNTLSLSVNGHPLSTVTDSKFREGNVGFTVCSVQPNSFAEVAFSNLTITTL
jgi:hypothetical protein